MSACCSAHTTVKLHQSGTLRQYITNHLIYIEKRIFCDPGRCWSASQQFAALAAKVCSAVAVSPALPKVYDKPNMLLAIIGNLEYGLAIEMMAGARGYDFLARGAASAPGTQDIYDTAPPTAG